MNLSRPLQVVTPTLDGDVLAVLANADYAFTPPQVQRLVGFSESGVRKSLNRLERQGIVSSSRAGNAVSYALNRKHVAAKYVEGLADLRAEVLRALADIVGGWTTPPRFAALFGSAATSRMRAESDLDLFVVRPDTLDPDDPGWAAQLDDLMTRASDMTGNNAQVLEMSESEVRTGLRRRIAPVLNDIREYGKVLAGPPLYLH